MYQDKGGDTSVHEQGCVITVYMQGARQREIEANLKFLDISSTLDIAQILKYSGFPKTQLLHWSELAGFLIVLI